MQSPSSDENPITPFAITNYRNIRRRFGIKEKDRRGHIYALGQTGTGKSTLIENMVISDMRQGNGLALIDPHGDLAEDVLHFVPKRRVKDVVYFNPADAEHPVAFNPLERVHPDQRYLVASGLVSVFKKIWQEFWGPRLEHILRHSLLTLLERPGSTLLDVPRLLTDREFRAAVVARVSSPPVREFWLYEFERYSAWLRSEAISPVLNKVGQFLTSAILRNIVGQGESTFDLRGLMDEGGILVVNLAKGRIGEDVCSLLGAMIVTKIQLASLSRANLAENERRSFYLYVDEFHSFLTLSFAEMLSEARKYGLSLTLSHQYIDQLDERIRAAVLGNIGTIIAFRVGAEDARRLAREFSPVFDEADLVSLPNHHIYLRLLIDGMASRPFSATTIPAPAKKTSHKGEVIELSRQQYGRPREEVEAGLLIRSSSAGEAHVKRLPI